MILAFTAPVKYCQKNYREKWEDELSKNKFFAYTKNLHFARFIRLKELADDPVISTYRKNSKKLAVFGITVFFFLPFLFITMMITEESWQELKELISAFL